MKVVCVRWIDSVRTGGWRPLEEALVEAATPNPAMTCETVGYLVFEDEIGVTVALSKSRNDKHICDTMLIPRVAIESMKVLQAGK